MSDKLKNILIWLTLGLLTISAFFIRLENFKRGDLRSIDEIVYYRMALQMSKNIADYNTIPYGKELRASGRELPDYFFEPLFKHPPLFSLLTTLSTKLFGPTLISSYYPSLLLGILIIPLTFLLGRLIFNNAVGLLAAFFVYLDPISIICSQKVWMDSTIAFFTLLTVLCFAHALHDKKDIFFLLSGIASGLAMTTKYTGILGIIIICVYVALYRRELFKNRWFMASLSIPFLMLLPWIYWNYQVYGSDLLTAQAKTEPMIAKIIDRLFYYKYILLGMILGLGILKYFQLKHSTPSALAKKETLEQQPSPLLLWISFIFVLTFLLLIKAQILHSLDVNFAPLTTWYQGAFSGEPPTFYFGKLVEFFFIYVFAYTALFRYHTDEKNETAILRIASLTIMVFFIAWGNYQSRYILSALPFLILLAANEIILIFSKIVKIHSPFLRILALGIFGVLAYYLLFKVSLVNAFVSFPNDMCYF